MNCIVRRLLPALLLLTAVLTIVVPTQAQDSSVSARPAITVLDSTKEQDGLLGSVRRVKTETARIEFKHGRPVEGAAQLVEITTYGIKGNRIENTSYPIGGGVAGKEEYKYDERGNITEMTVRDDRGAILTREAYTYEFDKFGNWTKMVTSLILFEDGKLKREPVEVTYRTVTYYYDDTVAKIVEEPKIVERPKPVLAPAIPEAASLEIQGREIPTPVLSAVSTSTEVPVGEPPPVLKSVAADKTDSKTINADPILEAEFHLALGHTYLKAQKDREAIKAFKESIKLNPNMAEPHYGLGFSNFRLGRFKDAADAFKRAINLQPRMAKAHYGLSLAYQELNNTSGVLEEYKILETLDKNLAKKLAQTFPEYNFSCRLVRGCP